LREDESRQERGAVPVASHMAEQGLVGGDNFPVRSSGVWVQEKFYYLRRYLDIFSVGMKNKWGGRLYYVDLFAGPGECRIRGSQEGEDIDGSPLIALEFDFAKYYFFESDPACFQALDARIKKRAPRKLEKVKMILGDCNETIEHAELPHEGLGVALIDPTGISRISFETIRNLATGRQIDLIINFPEGMGIRMNLHQYTQTESNALSRYTGSAKWRNRYQQSLTSFDQICTAIAKEYLANLQSLGYCAVDGDWIPVKTNQNALLYYLLFASKNPRGNEFWHKITRIDPYGQPGLFS
jgi:three-Cys-motif partner protein